ncbi:hypothetical protein J2772_002046 [Chryseobacterium jejuense]|nr:hypothetical protein [Chryseobacterium jejuense]
MANMGTKAYLIIRSAYSNCNKRTDIKQTLQKEIASLSIGFSYLSFLKLFTPQHKI